MLNEVFVRLTDSLFVFIVCMTLALIITYIKLIRGRMSQLIIENINLLNKMNEGLIVVSEKNEIVKVINKPALSLLKQIPIS